MGLWSDNLMKKGFNRELVHNRNIRKQKQELMLAKYIQVFMRMERIKKVFIFHCLCLSVMLIDPVFIMGY